MHAVSYSSTENLAVPVYSTSYCRSWPEFAIIVSGYLYRMCELLQSGEQSGERAQAANSLSALLSGGARRKAEVMHLSNLSVPADSVFGNVLCVLSLCRPCHQ